MQVILMEKVNKLGQLGEIVKVKPGYARNFLIPSGKARRATDAAIKEFEEKRAQLETSNLERKSEAEKSAVTVDGTSVIILRQASESNHLYGSVSPRDVAAALSEEGVEVNRAQVLMPEPLKMTGLHRVAVALHPEVEVEITVNIARSKEEADIQAGIKEAPPEEQPLPDELDNDGRDLGQFDFEQN